MTSTVTNYSDLIDVTFPVPGVDNDTQGFRSNYINIQQGFGVASSEISDLQQSNKDLITRLNDATVVGDNYAATVASTVTSIVLSTLQTTTVMLATSVPITSKGKVGDHIGMFFADQNFLYACTGTYNGSTDIWTKTAVTTSTW
jgi:hypothetical protein